MTEDHSLRRDTAVPAIDLEDAIDSGDLESVRAWFAAQNTVTISEELGRLDHGERAVAFRLLEKDRALAVFEYMDISHQRELLEALRSDRASELLRGLQDDDRARLIGEAPATVASKILADLPADKREATSRLLGYPPESAGRLMTPAQAVLDPAMTREDALDKLRGRRLRNRDIAVLAVTDETRRLLGVVNLSDLVTAADGARVGDLMSKETHSVRATADQEVAARLVQEADLLALPVVDEESRIVGMITVDDAMEALEIEVTEDAYRGGGSEPLGEPYLSATVFTLARKRGVWLVVLILAAVLTINVMSTFEGTLNKIVVLATFVPMIIGTGGNAGSQAASSVVRALAVDEVRPRDLVRVVWREVRVGLMLGAFLAVLTFPFIAVIYEPRIAATISLTIVGICAWACIVGGVLPLVAKKIGVDPAVFSTPVVSTLVDATGLIIYFTIAQVILAPQLAAAG
ncbi:magnesium transporter [Corynebacterium bovis]|uniref:Magnesium transporter MgtE n=1 Tax=Corynebacterium bovis TaxID=36808 RepID=A0A426PXB3_9CORY|nr:magnesium transporter [Corynebacterium bovis]MDN8578996.1 magnesium transporter [Corynebacterium bovis]RRO85924.1 magnesium transporter [Corynebacterium bovis]RRO89812.1 magnesium transporter [Corynebacterium bovis]